jgi:hypothetical protein
VWPKRIKDGALSPESTPTSAPNNPIKVNLISKPRKWILGNENGEIYAAGPTVCPDEEIEVIEVKNYTRTK